MKQIFTLLVAVFALQQSTLAQRVCGTTEYQMTLEQEDPSIINRREEIEQFTRDYLINNPQGDRALVTIPVVVHVVYNTAAENISDAQIQSQITVLNQDFRKLNADVANTPGAFAGLASDSNIEFCLATVDPNGNPTNGVLRVPTNAAPIIVLNRAALAARYGALDLAGLPDAGPVTLGITVADLAAAQTCLTKAGLPFSAIPGGGIAVAPAAAHGVILAFRAG